VDLLQQAKPVLSATEVQTVADLAAARLKSAAPVVSRIY
jgi:hypothetical protein